VRIGKLGTLLLFYGFSFDMALLTLTIDQL